MNDWYSVRQRPTVEELADHHQQAGHRAMTDYSNVLPSGLVLAYCLDCNWERRGRRP